MVLTLEKLLQDVDLTRLEALRRKYKHGPDKNPSWLKFLDWKRYGQDAIEWVGRVGLDRRACRSLNVLDVGCGLGWFVLAANRCGHAAIGLDIRDPFYTEAQDILGISVIRHGIVAGEPIPVDDFEFDVITMFGFGLPRQYPDGPSAVGWGPYSQMVRELLRHLRPGGLWFASINTGRDWLFSHRRWRALADEVGGRLDIEGDTVFKIRKGNV